MEESYTPAEQTKAAQAVPLAEPVPVGQQYPELGQPVSSDPAEQPLLQQEQPAHDENGYPTGRWPRHAVEITCKHCSH